uniref:Uncharacterized protein n=1 Tax=Moniliophthora roreri TaxID=221103 RepID=A0A0W0FJE8_MONRR
MIQDLGYTKSMLVALWTQTMLYGMNTVLFIMGKGKGAPINKPLLITAIVLYTLCAAHAINDLGRAIAAFISYENNPGGATAYYVQFSSVCAVDDRPIASTSAVADALLVYRLYVVWNFNVKIITGPVIVLLTTTVCGYRAVWGFSNIKQGEDTYAADIYTWGIALFALSLLLNLVVTSAIAGRMWWCGNRMAATLGQKHGRKYSQAMVIIVESGAIYSVCVFIVLITYATKTNGVYIAYDALAQIMGMNPILIIVRVGLGLTAHDTTYQLTVSRNTNTLFNSSGRDGSQRSDALSVQVHRVMQMKADGQEDGEELELSQASKHV